MDRSQGVRCQFEHWWKRRALCTSNKYCHETCHNASLPAAPFSPALDLVPDYFSLPPPYEEVIDIEKALHIHPGIDAGEDVSRLCIPAAPSHLHLSEAHRKDFIVQPTSGHIRIIRHFRYTVFTVYRRLFSFVVVLNAVGIYALIRQHTAGSGENTSLNTLASLASSNFLLAIVVRQDYLVGVLFRAAWLVPWSVPLRVRRMVARVYCYGGIHSGAAVTGTVWWLIFTAFMSWTFLKASVYTSLIVAITWIILGLLLSILVLSLPKVRTKYHDMFEMTHRFLGWASIVLFWTQLLLLAHYTSTTSVQPMHVILMHNLSCWSLTVITLLLIYPWLHLRRWTFTAHPLSSHALRLSFPNQIHKFSCLSISSSPLREWHPFATFPSTDTAEPGASIVISSAGDWTTCVIQHAAMRSRVQNAITKAFGIKEKEGLKMSFWVKSHPKAGVLSLSCLFPRVIIITTGSGIGPSLSSLLDRPKTQFARLIWSTRSPHHTYGAEMMDMVQQADPKALVIDTSAMGRPDLLDVAWRMYKETRAEAVFVLSNEAVTRLVVGGLEKRGVPAFGPIWDS